MEKIIVFRESENDNSISILTIQFNQKFILSIVDVEDKNTIYYNPFFIQIQTFSGEIIKKNNINNIIENLYINKNNIYINIDIKNCNYLEQYHVYHCYKFNNSEYNLTKGLYEIF